MKTIADSFQEFLHSIAPTRPQVDAAERHLGTIKARLSEVYLVKKYITAGSYSRGTFIRGKSDVDMFAVIARECFRRGDSYVSSGTFLNKVKSEMYARFTSTTVRRDVQAVALEFGDCSVDIVLAFYAGATPKGWPLYYIPNGTNGWMRTSPGLHNAYVKREDEAAGGKIRGTAQLLKFWRECRTPRVPLSSFHIEMVLASAGICKGAKSYAACVTQALQELAAKECRGLPDPMKVSGNIPSVRSEAQRERALASVRFSRDHAKSALQADYPGNLSEARRQWDIVFNGRFPW